MGEAVVMASLADEKPGYLDTVTGYLDVVTDPVNMLTEKVTDAVKGLLCRSGEATDTDVEPSQDDLDSTATSGDADQDIHASDDDTLDSATDPISGSDSEDTAQDDASAP